jgi:membrane fusion protein, heavy metal efflux system
MGDPHDRAGEAVRFPAGVCDRGQDLGQRRPGNACLLPVRRTRDQAFGEARRPGRSGADLAQSDANAAEAALEAARNRLRILGRSDEEIAKFQERRTITSGTPIFSPLDGTVVQRKVGPGQYIASGSADPVFLIGDLSSVWLVAFVRETEAPNVQVGQTVSFKVLAYPDRVFKTNVAYVSTAIDATSRRLLVRATIDNSEGLLRPEMFASVSIMTDEGDNALSIPRDAVIYEGDQTRIWVVRDDKGLELRRIKLGLVNGRHIEVKEGVRLGESVVTKGTLFIDREASGG